MFNKRKIETTCILLSFFLIIILAFLLIIAIADTIFHWDIFPKEIEKIMILFMAASGVIIAACFILSLMVNLSLISSNLEKIADSFKPEEKKKDE